jgi:hypothetical protein
VKSVDSRPTAVRTAQKCVDALPLDERVTEVSVWAFSEEAGGGWGWSVRITKAYGLDVGHDIHTAVELRSRDDKIVAILDGERRA